MSLCIEVSAKVALRTAGVTLGLSNWCQCHKIGRTMRLRKAPLATRLAALAVKRLPLGRYRLAHMLSRNPPPPFWAQLPGSVGGSRFVCDLRDGIAREVFFTGRYEPQETALVRHLLCPGAVFVDVGANWGYFTLLAAYLVGPDGRVVALEPEPRCHTTLVENVTENGMDNVTVLDLAAADGDGCLTLQGYDEALENYGTSRIVPSTAKKSGTIQVKASRLDDALDDLGLPRVDLVKMDIEGSEGAALAGLGRYLAAGRIQRLIVEIHSSQSAELGYSPAAVVQRVIGAGYTAWRIDHSPAATRATAYAREPDPSHLISKMGHSDALDEWPHLLFVREGSDPV